MRIVLTGNTCFKIANFREGLVRALLARGCEVVVLAPFDAYRAKLESMGCRVHDLPMDRNGTSPIAELVLLIRIFAFLRRERPAIVFGYTIKNNIYAGLACRWFGMPFVPNVTGLGPAFNGSGALNRLVRFLYGFAFAKAQAVFLQNPEDRATFLAAGLVDQDKALLLPGSGVDLERFQTTPMPLATEPLTFLLVARLLWDKGIGLYADAARQLRSEIPGVRFRLLGPLDHASRTAIPQKQIDDWVNEGIIEYLGHTQDVRPAIAAAHCVVLPSWYREGTPRILLEAAAIGRPVITTDMPGCRDAVQVGVTGILCEPRDLGALTDALSKFGAMTPQARSEMGRHARTLAEQKFDETRVIEQYIAQLPN